MIGGASSICFVIGAHGSKYSTVVLGKQIDVLML